MLSRFGSLTSSRCAGLVAAMWLCGIGSVWAGDSGSDTAIQPVLDVICTDVGMTSCPHVPTITQAILQMSGLQNAAPDFVRGPQGTLAANGFAALCSVSSGTGLNVCSQANAINAVNPSAASPVAVSDFAELPNLTPLAFTTGKGLAVPVPLGTSGANSYLYAVATPDQNGEITTLTLYFDYPLQTNSNIQKTVFAKISLPLQVLNNDGSERLICGAAPCPSLTSLATLQISGCDSGQGCVNGLAASVIGDFSTPGTIGTMSASQLNIGVSTSFAPSPNSASSHLIMQVQVPLLITLGNDPAYFGLPPFVTGSPTLVNQLSGLPTAFTRDVVPASGIGIAPEAAPKCSGTCPSTTFRTTFPFCASFAGSGSGPLGSGSFHSAVATFFTLGTDATTYVSSPVSLAGSMLQCPF